MIPLDVTALNSNPRAALSVGELYVSVWADFNSDIDDLQDCVDGFLIVGGRVEMVVNHATVLRYVLGEGV